MIDVHELVKHDLASGPEAPLLRDLGTRYERGNEKYGGLMFVSGKADWLPDAYQELLDFIHYSRAEIKRLDLDGIDTQWLRTAYQDVSRIALTVQREMERRLREP